MDSRQYGQQERVPDGTVPERSLVAAAIIPTVVAASVLAHEVTCRGTVEAVDADRMPVQARAENAARPI